MFVTKYRPKKISDYVGHKENVKTFLSWISGDRNKALLFHGPPGVGKTSLVEAFAAENSYDLVELNASDFRSAKAIQNTIGGSVAQGALFNRKKIFVIDEVDGLSSEDRGGTTEILKLIKATKHPIILIANNPWNPKLRELRQYCNMVEFKKLSVFDVEKKLGQIAEAEKITFDGNRLRLLASKSGGDLRAAINDLELVARGENSDIEEVGQREKIISIFDALKIIFKTKSALAAKLAINSTDKDVDEIFWWIENNVANEYEDRREIADAFEKLSRADLLRHRISRKQNWKLLAYCIDLMTAGVATAKKEMYRKFTRYQYPANIAFLGRTKFERSKQKESVQELAKELHCSMRKVRSEYVPYLEIFKQGKEN